LAKRRNRWQLTPPPAAPAGRSDPSPKILQDLARALIRTARPEDALQFALDRTCPAIGATLGAAYVVDGASELMRLEAAYGWPDRWRPWLGEMSVRLGIGPSGEAAAERRIIEVPDVLAVSGHEDWHEVAAELGFRSIVALPLEAPDAILGVATFYFADARAISPADRALLRAAADLMAAMAEREQLRTRVRRAEAALEEQQSPPAPRREETGERREDSGATDG
jgi:GAF domain-containing protein